MQVDIMRDLSLFDGEREELWVEKAECGCLWFGIVNLGVVPEELTHAEILEPCGRDV